MRAIERAYEWVKSLPEDQKAEMLKDLKATHTSIINAFKDNSITLAQVELLFTAESENAVKKASLEAELESKYAEKRKIETEIQEIVSKIDVLEVTAAKPIDQRTLMAMVRQKQIENMVAEGLKRKAIQDAIKEKVADIPIEEVAEVVTETPKKRRKAVK